MMQVLTDMELDAVAGGAAFARLDIASFLALGPNEAEVNAEDVEAVALTTGSQAPSDTAYIAGTWTARSR